MFKFFNKKQNRLLLDDIKNDNKNEVDMNNIISSMFHAEDLYNSLKVRCHPDKFIHDPELEQKANLLFQDITENRRNFKKLNELKKIAENELNIKF